MAASVSIPDQQTLCFCDPLPAFVCRIDIGLRRVAIAQSSAPVLKACLPFKPDESASLVAVGQFGGGWLPPLCQDIEALFWAGKPVQVSQCAFHQITDGGAGVFAHHPLINPQSQLAFGLVISAAGQDRQGSHALCEVSIIARDQGWQGRDGYGLHLGQLLVAQPHRQIAG